MLDRTELAHLQGIATAFVGGLIGFGSATLLLPGAHGTVRGIAIAAVVYSLLGKAIDLVLTHSSIEEHEWIEPIVLWFLTLIASVVLLVPVSAAAAPQYRLSGVAANLAAIALVYVAEWLAWRAAPWYTPITKR